MKSSPKLLWASCLAMIFFIAHALTLPSALEDIDSVNFALGLHDFDPVKHQPHPPGYPVFMALAKLVRVFVPSDVRALSLLGAICGALAIFPLMKLFASLIQLDDPSTGSGSPRASSRGDRRSTMDDGRWTIDDGRAALMTILTVASPLFWFNALRPLSDIPGLAATLAAQAVLAAAFVHQRTHPERTPQALEASGRLIVLGAFLSAIAIGMRSQAMWLTLPLLAIVLLQRAGRAAAGALLGSAMAFSIGVLLWLVPLVIATGGVTAYRAALAAQGGEDFSGVDMLYRNPTPRRLALSLLETFIFPWASTPLGWIVFALAAAGAVALLWRAPRAAIVIAALTVPYTIFHLLFQETVTTRYALPLIPPMAFLVATGAWTMSAAAGSRRSVLATVVITVLIVWSLAVTLPAARVYAEEPSPAFSAVRDLHAALGGDSNAVIGMHQGLARSIQADNFGSVRILKSPPMREWLELADYWRSGNAAPVWFLADPARTDIELIDPMSRHLQKHYVWHFPRERFIGGVRPDIVDLIRIDSPPGWFAEEGWHLTSETLNMSERLRRHEAVAYVKGRPAAALMIVGGESTGAESQITLTIDDRLVDRWTVQPASAFFKRIHLDPGALTSASGFAKVIASYRAADGTPGHVRLTQFAVEPNDSSFFVQAGGWNELEYSKQLQRRWRWTTGKATTFVNSGGRDLTLHVSGESPLKYFDTPPHVVVRAGNQVLATQSPSSDFSFDVKLPAAAVDAADGFVTIETDRTFVPNERSGVADKRTLGLRIFDFEIH